MRYLGYRTTFLIAACVMLASALFFILSSRFIQPHPGRSIKGRFSKTLSVNLVLATIVLGALLCTQLLEHIAVINTLMLLLVIGSCIFILRFAFKQQDKLSRQKLIAFLILALTALVFWTLYALEPSLLTIFIENNVSRTIGSSTIPPSAYYSLDAIFVIIFGLVLSWLWVFLEKRRRDPSLPTKFSISLVCMGIGFLVILFGIYLANPHTHLVNMSWVILGYLCFSIAELLIAPIGLSMVGRLAPKGQEGMLMGIWTVFIGFGAIISEYIGKLTATPKRGLPVETNTIYSHSFLAVGLSSIAIGIIAALLIPWLKTLIKPQVTN